MVIQDDVLYRVTVKVNIDINYEDIRPKKVEQLFYTTYKDGLNFLKSHVKRVLYALINTAGPDDSTVLNLVKGISDYLSLLNISTNDVVIGDERISYSIHAVRVVSEDNRFYFQELNA